MGEILIGFGLLFYGLGALKDAVPDVKSMLASTEPEIVQKAESWKAESWKAESRSFNWLFVDSNRRIHRVVDYRIRCQGKDE